MIRIVVMTIAWLGTSVVVITEPDPEWWMLAANIFIGIILAANVRLWWLQRKENNNGSTRLSD